MSDDETVRMEVTLAWSYSIHHHKEEYDTGIPVDEWNEMSEEARGKVLDEAYEEVLSGQAMGGARVVTEGAKEV